MTGYEHKVQKTQNKVH